jgi:hypothetical protein
MATQAVYPATFDSAVHVQRLATFPQFRALAWHGDVLYASRGYGVFKTRANSSPFEWTSVGGYRPEWWRQSTSRSKLSYRLVRDGFHALAVHPGSNLIAAVPGAIVTLQSGQSEFHISHRVLRGTRPLHITATPEGRVYWGEYFDNPRRNEVHIYASEDAGTSWQVAHSFPKRSIRHIHNIVYDRWRKCLWIFTGDYGKECKILRASLDLATLDEVVVGNQQVRAVAAIVNEDGLYFASDTPLERNYIYRLNLDGCVKKCSALPSSSIYGCRNRSGMFFSTMVEPSPVNHSRGVTLVGSLVGERWDAVAQWRKDRWPMKYFQYGNAFLPDGENSTDLLAVSTIAVTGADCVTSIWKTSAV